MARHFSEEDIDEFRDCFYLNTCSSGQVTDVKELKTIMRSLGMSPTLAELETYLSGKGAVLLPCSPFDRLLTRCQVADCPLPTS